MRFSIKFLTALILWVGTTATLVGQSQESVPEDSIQGPKALPISEIPKLTEILNTTRQEVDQLVQRPEFVDEITAALPGVVTKVDSIYALYADTTLSYTYSQLDRAQAIWATYSKQTNDWNAQVANRIKTVEAEKQKVSTQQQVAILTLESTIEQEAPREVVRSVRSVVNELNVEMSKLQQVVNKQLRIQTSITPTIAKINSGRAFVAQRRDEMRNSLWQIGEEPLWRAEGDTTHLIALIGKEYTDDVRVAYNYWMDDESFRFVVPIFFIILAVYLIFFRVGTKELMKDHKEEVLKVRLLIKYPIQSALFITFIFTMLALKPVSELNRVFSLLILIPTCYIFYTASSHYKREQVGIFVGLMVYFQLHIPLETTFAGRIMTLVVTLALLAIAGDVIFRRRLVVFKPQFRPYLVLVAQIFTVLLFGSVISNIVGAMQLARLLTDGIMVSMLIAVIFYLTVFLMTDVVSAIMIKSPLAKSNIVKKHRSKLRKQAQRLFSVLGLLGWLNYTLEVFGIGEIVLGSIQSFVTYSVQVGTIAISMWDIIAFFLTLQVSFWISRFIRFILEEEVYVRTKTEDKGVTGTIALLIRYSVISLGVVLAFAAAGIEFDKLALLIGALGVGIGFGLQSIFSNLISGVILALERPMKIGDVIEVKSLMGTVQDIGFRASIVRSFDGADVIIPNGDFLSSEFINWTRSDSRRRLAVNVGVAYGTDPNLVLKLLRETADENDVVLKYPAPITRFLEMGESSLDFQLLYWIPDFDNSFSMGTQMTTQVYRKITEAGITIPFPQQDVYLHSMEGDPGPPPISPSQSKPQAEGDGTEESLTEPNSD